MIKLREYQEKTINSLRQKMSIGLKRLIMSCATGGGKTVMFCYMINQALQKNKRCLILTHRTELLTQAGGTLENFGLVPIIVNPKNKKLDFTKNLYVAMTKTVMARINNNQNQNEIVNYLNWLQSFDLIIIDESHLQDFNSLFDYIDLQKTFVIGATATAERKGNQSSLDEFYQDIVNEITISELIELGFLAKPNYYGFKVDLKEVKIKSGDYDGQSLGEFMSKNKIFKGVYENYTKITPNKKALIFAPSIASSKELVLELSKKGLSIKHLDGETPADERKKILTWFKETPNALLSNVGILTAGYDEPSIEVIILYRATKSLSLYLQMVGRGSRTTETKKEFTILDFGNNIYTHDFWHIDRNWSLAKQIKEKGLAPVKTCKNCSAIIPAQASICEYCNAEQPKTKEQRQEALNIELQKITSNDVANFIALQNFEKLEQYANFKGYKKSWVYYRLPLEQLQAYSDYKGYNAGWVAQIKLIRNGK